MANIEKHLDNIKGALYGKDVRSSIHDGIDAINKEVESATLKQTDLENTFDQLIINSGNSNAEIVDARVKADGTSYAKLGDRLNKSDEKQEEISSQLEHNVKHTEGWVNVKNFGCVGDGLTDDTLNFQKALDTGLNVIVPPGTYLVGDLRMYKGQILDGLCSFIYSWGKEKKKTILIGKSEANYVIADCRGGCIRNIHICGNTKSTHGIFAGNQEQDEYNQLDGNVEIYNCRIYDCIRGIDSSRCGTVIHKNNIDHNTYGIYKLTDTRVINNTINQNEIGIYAYDSNDNIISNNKIEWNTKEGLKFEIGANNVISSNIIDRNSTGIYLKSVDRGSVIGNVIRRNLEHNITYDGVTRFITNGNNLISGHTVGENSGDILPKYHLWLKSFGNSIITNNATSGGDFINPSYDYRTSFICENNIGTNLYKDKIFKNFNHTVNAGESNYIELDYPEGFTQINTHITSLKIGESNENFKYNSDVVTYNVVMNADKIRINFKNTNNEYKLTLRVSMILEKEH